MQCKTFFAPLLLPCILHHLLPRPLPRPHIISSTLSLGVLSSYLYKIYICSVKRLFILLPLSSLLLPCFLDHPHNLPSHIPSSPISSSFSLALIISRSHILYSPHLFLAFSFYISLILIIYRSHALSLFLPLSSSPFLSLLHPLNLNIPISYPPLSLNIVRILSLYLSLPQYLPLRTIYNISPTFSLI